MRVAFIILGHYNFESSSYCLLNNIKALMTTKIDYDIYYIDTSIKQKDKFNDFKNSFSDYNINFMGLDYDYAVNSKKNLFYKKYLNNYDLFVELENDVYLTAKRPDWLEKLSQIIESHESKNPNLNMVWGLSYNIINNTICTPTACQIISKKNKLIVGDLPSELTGEYGSSMEEMIFFPRDTTNLLSSKYFSTYTAGNLVELKFDLYSISTNFINHFREHVADFDYLKLDLSDNEKLKVAKALEIAKSKCNEYGPYPKLLLNGTDVTKTKILDILRCNSTLDRGVGISLYKKIYTSLFIRNTDYKTIKDKYNLNTDKLLESEVLFICDDLYFFNIMKNENKVLCDELIFDILKIMLAIKVDRRPLLVASSEKIKARGGTEENS